MGVWSHWLSLRNPFICSLRQYMYVRSRSSICSCLLVRKARRDTTITQEMRTWTSPGMLSTIKFGYRRAFIIAFTVFRIPHTSSLSLPSHCWQLQPDSPTIQAWSIVRTLFLSLPLSHPNRTNTAAGNRIPSPSDLIEYLRSFRRSFRYGSSKSRLSTSLPASSDSSSFLSSTLSNPYTLSPLLFLLSIVNIYTFVPTYVNFFSDRFYSLKFVTSVYLDNIKLPPTSPSLSPKLLSLSISRTPQPLPSALSCSRPLPYAGPRMGRWKRSYALCARYVQSIRLP